jgi:surface antigen
MPNHYIRKRGDKWVIVQKGTGKVLSTHDTKAKAEASFRALEASKHGAVMRNK